MAQLELEILSKHFRILLGRLMSKSAANLYVSTPLPSSVRLLAIDLIEAFE